LHSHFHFEPQT
jgi:hypothetical protein